MSERDEKDVVNKAKFGSQLKEVKSFHGYEFETLGPVEGEINYDTIIVKSTLASKNNAQQVHQEVAFGFSRLDC
jgi:hypothetical protein